MSKETQNFKLSTKLKYGIYTVLGEVLLLLSCTSGDTEGISLWQWFKQPITDLSIGEFIVIVVIVGWVTN